LDLYDKRKAIQEIIGMKVFSLFYFEKYFGGLLWVAHCTRDFGSGKGGIRHVRSHAQLLQVLGCELGCLNQGLGCC
jgi:hypothetical protein